MTFDWEKQPLVTHIQGSRHIRLHTPEDPGHEVHVLDGHWALGAISDLLRRVKELESRRFIKVEQYSANGPEEMVNIIDLQARVDEFVKWVEQAWTYDGEGGKDYDNVSLKKHSVKSKLRELGLMKEGD